MTAVHTGVETSKMALAFNVLMNRRPADHHLSNCALISGWQQDWFHVTE